MMLPLDDLQITLARWLARTVAPYLPPSPPRSATLTFSRKESSMLVFRLNLAPPADPSIAKRTLTVVVNGGDPQVGPAADGMELTFAPTDAVVLTVVDTNAAGIDSAPSAPLSFVAASLAPPATPTTPTLTFLREDPDPVPVPDPAPTPAPATDTTTAA